MRDAAAAEAAGIPTTIVVVDVIADMVRGTARNAGVAIPIVTVPEVLFGLSRAQIADCTEPHVKGIVDGLAGRPPRAAG